MSQTSYLSIGEVVRRLQGRYPDLTVSKVRFLEDKGLIEPERTAGGYRKFAPEDVSRLDAILKMQKMHFYPLTVIKSKLDAADKGEPIAELDALDDSAAEEARQLLAGQPQELTAVAEMLDVPTAFIRDLSQYGLVSIQKGQSGPVVDGGSIGLIKACWGLREQGIDPRHLRTFVTAADREANLLVQVVLPQLKASGADSHKQGLERLRELEALMGAVKQSLLRNALDEELRGVSE